MGRLKRPEPSGTVLVRAEICSHDEFVLHLEGARDRETHEVIVEELASASQDSRSALRLREQLALVDRCTLDASVYSRLNFALTVAGRHVVGGPFFWIGIPPWVVKLLPTFSGVDPVILGAKKGGLWLPDGLMAYQKFGVERACMQAGRVLLADEMGLGKTAQALGVVAQYLDNEGPALVVTPSSLGATWAEQVRRWLPQRLGPREVQVVLGSNERPSPLAKIVIVSYALFSRAVQGFAKPANADQWDIIVCDEAHNLRNPNSQRSQALLPMLQRAKRAILVTGTPTPKQASEAFSLLHALRPLSCTYKEWCARYGPDNTIEGREPEVAAILQEVMIRRCKVDLLSDLPAKERSRVVLSLPNSASAALKKLQNEAAAANSAVKDEAYFRQLASVKQAAVLEYVDYIIDACSHKFLLFAHHHSMLNALDAALTKRSMGFIRIDGTTPAVQRAGLVRDFQEAPNIRAAVLSVIAAGEGLTLTAAPLCIFCELCPAVPGCIEQAEARIHRIGQMARTVDVHFLTVEGTRDDFVFERLQSRAARVSRVVGNMPQEDLPGAEPTIDTLFEDAKPAETKGSKRKAAENGAMPVQKRRPRRSAFDLGAAMDLELAKLRGEVEDKAVSPASPEDAAAAEAPADGDGDKNVAEGPAKAKGKAKSKAKAAPPASPEDAAGAEVPADGEADNTVAAGPAKAKGKAKSKAKAKAKEKAASAPKAKAKADSNAKARGKAKAKAKAAATETAENSSDDEPLVRKALSGNSMSPPASKAVVDDDSDDDVFLRSLKEFAINRQAASSEQVVPPDHETASAAAATSDAERGVCPEDSAEPSKDEASGSRSAEELTSRPPPPAVAPRDSPPSDDSDEDPLSSLLGGLIDGAQRTL
eukprot:TRINITY_DN1677_c2_g1_i1.p1 TRINITY_DN1677_c2_g1~~TRINITY_DN1677_c2_g1_i1.p1  ORF type:complete len:891 (-),score=239.03 TRINITY_DN1677_c2_g1_i1:232-2862(-)